MLDYIWNNIEVIGISGGAIAILLVLGYIFPQFRLYALVLGGAVLFGARKYRQGWFASRLAQKARVDKMVQKKQEKYREIDRSPSSIRSLVNRLRSGRGDV